VVSVAATFIVILTASGFSWRKPKLSDLAPATIYHKADSQAHRVYARGTKFFSDMRVVYEIQSRLRQDNDLPTTPESTVPQSSPNGQPGRTDKTNPRRPGSRTAPTRSAGIFSSGRRMPDANRLLWREESSMKCAVHFDVDAVGYCRNCGKAMCSTCVRPVRDVLYCEDCLALSLAFPAPRRPLRRTLQRQRPSRFPPACSAATRGSPGVAFFLGLFPGLGAVYNGEYNKALVHIVVFAAIIVGLSSDPGDGGAITLSLLLAGFVMYMAFDAMRTAKARRLGEPTADPLEAWSKNRPVGPIILIALGALFLSEQF